MSAPGRGEDAQAAQVSPFSVPALLGGIVLGFIAAYLVHWWAVILLGVAATGALAVILRGSAHREAAIAGVLGILLGCLGVVLLAVLN